MTVAIACNVSDGVILGVDSAVTVPAPGGALKVYEKGEKLFQLRGKPIGIAVYGLGSIAERSLGSYLREFEQGDPDGVVSGKSDVKNVCEQLRKFFASAYADIIVPLLEKESGKKVKEIPEGQKPPIGFLVGGFSSGQPLSEVWNVVIPKHSKANSSIQLRKPGQFGTNWAAQYAPIQRYIKGFDQNLINEVGGYFVSLLGRAPTQQEQDNLTKIINKHEYRVPYGAMPLEEGVDHTRFLVELVINHYKYVAGAPVVGGRAQIGKVSYRAEEFELLDS